MNIEQTTKERDPKTKLFEYFSVPSSTEIFNEITVVVKFTIGLKEPRSFVGGTHVIRENDAKKMEVESFFEAAEKAWNEHYKKSSDPAAVEFVKNKLQNKWQELNGEKLINKTLTLR